MLALVFHGDMAFQEDVVCHDDSVADPTVMRHMRSCHQETAAADVSDAAPAHCSRMCRDAFSYGAPAADF